MSSESCTKSEDGGINGALQRVEWKFDHIIEILEDKTITPDEEHLIRETDLLVNQKRFAEFIPL
jgi:hypothetical protein